MKLPVKRLHQFYLIALVLSDVAIAVPGIAILFMNPWDDGILTERSILGLLTVFLLLIVAALNISCYRQNYKNWVTVEWNRTTRRKLAGFTCGTLVVYLGTYCLLSCNGGYVWTQSGEVRWSFGMSATDLEQWQPRFIFCQRFRQIDGTYTTRANLLGYFFAPLVFFDQVYVHKTVRLFDPVRGKANGAFARPAPTLKP